MQSRIDHPPCGDSARLALPRGHNPRGTRVLASPANPRFCPRRVRPHGPAPPWSGDRGRAGNCATGVGNGECRVARWRPRGDRILLVDNGRTKIVNGDLSNCLGKPQNWTGMTSSARRASDGRMLGWIKRRPEMVVTEDAGMRGKRRTTRAAVLRSVVEGDSGRNSAFSAPAPKNDAHWHA